MPLLSMSSSVRCTDHGAWPRLRALSCARYSGNAMWWWTSIRAAAAGPPVLWHPGNTVPAPRAASPARNRRRGAAASRAVSVLMSPLLRFKLGKESQRIVAIDRHALGRAQAAPGEVRTDFPAVPEGIVGSVQHLRGGNEGKQGLQRALMVA